MKTWQRRTLLGLGLFAGSLLAVHVGIGVFARMSPPEVVVPAQRAPTVLPSGVKKLGRSYLTRRGKLQVSALYGSPEEIGFAYARLLYDKMVKNEGLLLGTFESHVSSRLGRTVLLDLAQLRFHDVDEAMSEARRRELAAAARGFSPDPYRDVFSTYQRFVYLNALYDISLSFEKSPLIGCTTYAWSGGETPMLARNFDFEVHEVFDRDKVVFLVFEKGKIPFASVAWPGLVGVVSGMNRHGLALVVHGARAGEINTAGEPVVHALRRVLSSAKNAEEALRAFNQRSAMVSHLVILQDASGRQWTLERLPNRDAHVITLPAKAVVTNHLQGPAAKDPKNLWVEKNTSTLPRFQRAKELVGRHPRALRPEQALALLRDKKALGDQPLEPGDRRAIDANIATHGVIFRPQEGKMWVSEGPHLKGRFIELDLKRDLEPGHEPKFEKKPAYLPAE